LDCGLGLFLDLVVSCDTFTSFSKFVSSLKSMYHSLQIRKRRIVFRSRPWCFHVHGDSASTQLLRPDMHFSLGSQFFRMSSVLCLFWEFPTQTLSHWKLRHDFIQLQIIYLNFFKQFIDSQFYRVCWFAIHIFNLLLIKLFCLLNFLQKFRNKNYGSCMHDMCHFRSNIKFKKKKKKIYEKKLFVKVVIQPTCTDDK